MSYLGYMSLLIVVSNTFCFLVFFFFVLFPMLPVSLDCPFLIATSVYLFTLFSVVYNNTHYAVNKAIYP